MKRILSMILVAVVCVCTATSEPQNGRIITITAGTAQRIVTNRVMANSMLVQPLHGGTGLVYVLNAAPNFTCGNGSAGTTFVAELGPATTTAPGSTFTFPSNSSGTTQAGGFSLQYWCIDGAHSGDTVAVSWDQR